MQKSTLVFFFKKLSKSDWRAFRKFVRSPYFNQRTDVICLCDRIDEAIRRQKVSLLDRYSVFEYLYPKEAFDEKKLRHTSSELLSVLKKYLLQKEFEADGISPQRYLCRALRKREIDTHFEKTLVNARRELDKLSFRNSNYYFQKYELGLQRAVYTMPKRRSGEMNFEAISEDLTISYISGILRMACNIQSQLTQVNQIEVLRLFPHVLNLLESGIYQDIPSISLYFHCFRAIQFLEIQEMEKSEESFVQLKEQIRAYWQLLPSSEIRDIYLFAVNYCIRRLNTGDRRFIREAFELFRSGLKNETLLVEGTLSSFTYKNITRLGMALQENEWVEAFLADYKSYLRPRERDNAWRYNLAFFYFQQALYKQAMPLLQQVEFKDVLNNLDARRMLLKSYFELGEYDALDSLLDSFSRYIQRQKAMGYHKENYLNLIRFVRKMIDGGLTNNQEKAAFKAEIQNTTRLAEREWLLEKLDE